MSELNEVFEKLGKIEMKADAANSRIDEFKKAVGDDIKEMKDDLKKLMAAENKRTGWIAAMMLVGTIASGIIGYFLKG